MVKTMMMEMMVLVTFMNVMMTTSTCYITEHNQPTVSHLGGYIQDSHELIQQQR